MVGYITKRVLGAVAVAAAFWFLAQNGVNL